jgi:hypothetical protein
VNELVRDLVGEGERLVFGGCAYCGHPCLGRACRAHSDLPELDPTFLARKGSVLTTFRAPKGATS